MSATYYEKEYYNDDTEYYRHYYRVTESHLPVINLAIVSDKARGNLRLKIEPNDFFYDKKLFSIFWKVKGNNDFGQFFYDGEGPLYDYEFAAEICKYLQIDLIEMNYCGMPLFDKRRTEVFMKTFEDFHKLVSGQLTL